MATKHLLIQVDATKTLCGAWCSHLHHPHGQCGLFQQNLTWRAGSSKPVRLQACRDAEMVKVFPDQWKAAPKGGK